MFLSVWLDRNLLGIHFQNHFDKVCFLFLKREVFFAYMSFEVE